MADKKWRLKPEITTGFKSVMVIGLKVIFFILLLIILKIWWPASLKMEMPKESHWIWTMGGAIIVISILAWLAYLKAEAKKKSNQTNDTIGDNNSPPPTTPTSWEDWWKKNSALVVGVGLLIVINILLWVAMNDNLRGWYWGKPVFILNIGIVGLVLSSLLPKNQKWLQLPIVALVLVILVAFSYVSYADSPTAKSRAALKAKERQEEETRQSIEKETRRIISSTSVPASGQSNQIPLPNISDFSVKYDSGELIAEIYDYSGKMIRRVDTTGKNIFGERNDFKYLPDDCTARFTSGTGQPVKVEIIR